MNNRDLYHAVSDGHGGVRLLPKPGSMARSVDYYYRQAVKFADADPQVFGDARRVRRRKRRTRDTPPINNLGPGGGREFLPGRSPKGFKDQAGPIRAATRGVEHLHELGEEFNRDQADPMGMARGQVQGRGLHDQDPEEDPDGEMQEEELVGTLPECPPGMRYQLEREPTGEINVVLVPDDSDGPTTHDRTFRHRIFRDGERDPVLTRMNAVNRGTHSRDAATMRRTMLRLTPAKGEIVEMVPNETPGGTGGFDVILVSPVYDPLEPAPKGAMELPMSGEDEDAVCMPSDATTGRGGEHEFIKLESSSGKLGGQGRDHRFRVPERQQLRSMNDAAKRFWAAR